MNGSDPYIQAMTVYDGQLMAGGSFTTAGGAAANYIASWDGSNWSPLGSGMSSSGSVCDLTVYNGKLIAGGGFTIAGNKVSAYLAQWTKTSDDVKDLPGSDILPSQYCLNQNHPNPFNPVTEIGFSLPRRCNVSLDVYNIIGQKVAIIVDKSLSAGYYIATWNGNSSSGQPAASGVYFYRLTAGEFIDTKKMILLK
jgi:hypothetical protein